MYLMALSAKLVQQYQWVVTSDEWLSLTLAEIAEKKTPTFFPAPNATGPRRYLYCFAYGGGVSAASVYQRWETQLGSAFQVFPVRLLGRKDALGEAPCRSMEHLCQDISTALLAHSHLASEVLFYGHSVGAMIAFHCAQKLEGQIPLKVLFAGACSAPQVTPNPLLQRFRTISKMQEIPEGETVDLDAAISWLKEFQFAIPQFSELVQTQQEAFKRQFVRSILADLALMESCADKNKISLNRCAIVAVGGGADEMVSEADVRQWKLSSGARFRCEILKQAPHLFIDEDKYLQLILRLIAEQ
jgi:surfactin synthase thioesterase subunit